MKFIVLVVCFAIVTACSYRITRSNYNFYNGGNRAITVVYKKHLRINDSLVKVGEIDLEESGYTLVCSENEALRLLKNEARVLNANVINIINEKRPGINGSCYQCKAQFFRFAYEGMVMRNDDYYSAKQLKRRRTRDRVVMGSVIVLSALTGLLLGLRYY